MLPPSCRITFQNGGLIGFVSVKCTVVWTHAGDVDRNDCLGAAFVSIHAGCQVVCVCVCATLSRRSCSLQQFIHNYMKSQVSL